MNEKQENQGTLNKTEPKPTIKEILAEIYSNDLEFKAMVFALVVGIIGSLLFTSIFMMFQIICKIL